jgi:hypothetical protein
MVSPRRTLLVLAIACIGAPVAAAAEPHTRLGLCAGVGFGLESVSWSDEDGQRDAEESGAANLRIGYAVKPGLVLGVEFWGWARESEILTSTAPVPVNVTLTATNACLSYFPGNAGFFIRLGAGLAYGRLEVAPPSSVTSTSRGWIAPCQTPRSWAACRPATTARSHGRVASSV